jgi:hypothetical protein
MTSRPPLAPAPAADGPRPFWNPYVAGFGLGLTLLLAFVTLGAGLGASGSIARVGAAAAGVVAPAATRANGYVGPWFEGGSPLDYYLVYMSVGALVGGFVSAFAARRVRVGEVERGPRAGVGLRLALAAAGGVLVGFASRMAGGCTSGQALSGGALFLDGSWVFTMTTFAGAYGAAWFVRRQWL